MFIVVRGLLQEGRGDVVIVRVINLCLSSHLFRDVQVGPGLHQHSDGVRIAISTGDDQSRVATILHSRGPQEEEWGVYGDDGAGHGGRGGGGGGVCWWCGFRWR